MLNPAPLVWASGNLELITLRGSWVEMQPSMQSASKHVTSHIHIIFIYIHGHVSVSGDIRVSFRFDVDLPGAELFLLC